MSRRIASVRRRDVEHAFGVAVAQSMPFLVGYKADGDLSYMPRNAERGVHLIAIDRKAQRTAVEGLTLARLEIRYVSVLMRQPKGTYKYESRRKESTLEENPLALPAAG